MDSKPSPLANPTATTRMKTIAIVSVLGAGLLGIAVGIGIEDIKKKAEAITRVDSFHLTYAGISNPDGPIATGWIPPILPASTSHLILRRDTDNNQACAMFRVAKEDRQKLFDHCSTVTLPLVRLPDESFTTPIVWWPRQFNDRNYTFHKYSTDQSQSRVMIFAEENGVPDTLWYWLEKSK